ncbi:MAG: hypothetical protein GVX90_02675, partial [Alphaproteobacteria bacterium]|nr:hypothetical protein [Alphaproteobacteria bacterium]
MAIEIKMPALSPTMEEGTLAKWLVKEGDHIGPGDIMAEIETDKATMEFEAVEEGTLAKIAVPEGTENVKVGTIIAMLAEEGEDAGDVTVPDQSAAPAPTPQPAPSPAPAPPPAESSAPSPSPPPKQSPAPKDGPAASPSARKLAEANGIDLSQIEGSGPKGRITKGDVEAAMGGGGAASVTGANAPAPAPAPAPTPSSTPAPTSAPAASGERIIASPLARRMAEQQGIDLAQVTGTGPNGRIVKADIENFDASAAPAPAPSATAEAPAAPSPQDAPDHGAPFEEEQLSNVRKVIARRLTESKQTVPHYYLTIDIRLDPLLDLRKQLNASLDA